MFHRDSGSGYIAKEAIEFLKNNNVNFTDKEEWMPRPQKLARWISVCGEFSSAFTKAVCQHFPWSCKQAKRMNGINLNIKK